MGQSKVGEQLGKGTRLKPTFGDIFTEEIEVSIVARPIH